MQQIIKIEENKRSSFLQALSGTLIRHATLEQVADVVSSGIEKAWFDLGLKQPSDTKDKDALKAGVITEIKSCFNTLTLDEIRAAIYLGARGRYGEVYGLTVIGVAKWFAAYMTDQARVEAKNELKALTEPPVLPPTPAKLAQLKRHNIIQAHSQFKATGKYFDSANRVYDNLVEMGLLSFTSQRKNEFMRQAIREAKENSNPVMGRSIHERCAFKKASDKLLQLERNGIISKDAAIIADAKRIALVTFFKELGSEELKF